MLKKIFPAALIILWILPVAWVGLMQANYPLYPSWMAPLFRVSGVFENGPSRWRIFFIEVKDASDWSYVNERLLFAPTPLGDRTRFQPLMAEIVKSRPDQAARLAEWIGHRLQIASPRASSVKAVRIIHFLIPPETFLHCASLEEVYRKAREMGLSPMVDSTLPISSSFHENH